MSHWAESCLVLSSFFLTLSYGYVSLSRRVFILSFLSLDSSTWFRLAFFSSLSMLPFLAFPSRKILIFNRWAWTTRSSLEKCFFEQRKRTSLKKQRLKKTWRVITRSSTSVQFDEEEQRQERDSRQTRHPSSSSFCLIESLWFFSSYSSSGLVLASFLFPLMWPLHCVQFSSCVDLLRDCPSRDCFRFRTKGTLDKSIVSPE